MQRKALGGERREGKEGTCLPLVGGQTLYSPMHLQEKDPGKGPKKHGDLGKTLSREHDGHVFTLKSPSSPNCILGVTGPWDPESGMVGIGRTGARQKGCLCCRVQPSWSQSHLWREK